LVKITSAVYSPRLKKNIALAMVSIEQCEIGNELKVNTNEGLFNCKIVEKPFYDPKKKIVST
jgi:aminomethyltransferase